MERIPRVSKQWWFERIHSFDAFTDNLPCKKSWKQRQHINELWRCEGVKVCPNVCLVAYAYFSWYLGEEEQGECHGDGHMSVCEGKQQHPVRMERWTGEPEGHTASSPITSVLWLQTQTLLFVMSERFRNIRRHFTGTSGTWRREAARCGWRCPCNEVRGRLRGPVWRRSTRSCPSTGTGAQLWQKKERNHDFIMPYFMVNTDRQLPLDQGSVGPLATNHPLLVYVATCWL